MRSMACRFSASVVTWSVAFQIIGLLTSFFNKKHKCCVVSTLSFKLYLLAALMRCPVINIWNAYTPSDETGDGLFHTLEFLLMATIIHCHYISQKWDIKPKKTAKRNLIHHEWMVSALCVFGCVVLGIFVHSDLMVFPLGDCLYASSMYMDTVSFLPEIVRVWNKKNDIVATQQSAPFVVFFFLSRLCYLSFWCFTYKTFVLYSSNTWMPMVMLFCAGIQVSVSFVLLVFHFSTNHREFRLLFGTSDMIPL